MLWVPRASQGFAGQNLEKSHGDFKGQIVEFYYETGFISLFFTRSPGEMRKTC